MAVLAVPTQGFQLIGRVQDGFSNKRKLRVCNGPGWMPVLMLFCAKNGPWLFALARMVAVWADGCGMSW